MKMSYSEGQYPQKSRDKYLLYLYIAGHGPNSVRATANLNEICEEYLPDRYTIEVIDILESPLRAISDGVLVTPTLIKVSPPPMSKIIGNLEDKEKVVSMLGLSGDSH
jgi:circadian clock protein KaiB